MPDVNDQAARRAIEYGITIFKTLRAHTKNITEAMIATSAMLQVIADQSPQMAEQYERYRAASEATSPLAEKSRAICAQFDDIVKP